MTLRRPIIVAIAGLGLLARVLAGGRALGAEDQVVAGLPSWAGPAGGGLGLTAVGALIAAFSKGWIRIGPVEEDQRHGPGRRKADEEAAAALARAREEGRAEGRREERAESTLADLEERIAKLEQAVGPNLHAHRAELGRLVATLSRIEDAVTGGAPPRAPR